MEQIKSQYESVVNNAQKSYEKFKSIFKQSTSESSNEDPSVKEDSKQFKHHDNYDIDEDEQSISAKNKLESSLASTQLQSEEEYNEAEEDIWEISHRIFVKRSMVDIENMPYVNFIKKKKTENMLSLIGFGKPNVQVKDIKYIALFDESFIYMIKMTEKENNQNNFNKKIGNHYDIRLISNIHMKDDKNFKCVSLLFLLNNDIEDYKSLLKEFYLAPSEAKRFLNMLKFYMEKLKVPFRFKDSSIYL